MKSKFVICLSCNKILDSENGHEEHVFVKPQTKYGHYLLEAYLKRGDMIDERKNKGGKRTPSPVKAKQQTK